jgi:hypothetical protein
MQSFPPPASRNSPCPCGSGKRYKDCHGALAGGAAPATGVRARSVYRAPEAEWGTLSEAERDECGALMERALAFQVAGRIDEAARDYAEVLARAPRTHDALHMAGVIELTRRNLDAAERLIVAAMALRPRYQAIEHNLSLVEDARLAASRAKPEALCERALPILAELALAREAVAPARPLAALRAGTSQREIHLIGRAHAGDDDGTWMLARVAALLARDAPGVWATDGVAEPLRNRRSRALDADAGVYPRGGTHVFVGVSLEDTRWIERADAHRVVVLCFGAAPSGYLDRLRAIARDGARAVELAFTSHAMADRFGRGHAVLPPPIELPALAGRSAEGGTTLRVGVDGQGRHRVAEPDDVDFLRALAATAGGLHVYDPARLRYALGGDARVRSFARRGNGLEAFIRSLSCFVHRAERWWDESLARALFAAVGAGVPVVCARQSIHAEYFEHEVDALLYASHEEALQHVAALRSSPARAAALGVAARRKAERLFEPGALAQRYAQVLAGRTDEAPLQRVAYPSGSVETSR